MVLVVVESVVVRRVCAVGNIGLVGANSWASLVWRDRGDRPMACREENWAVRDDQRAGSIF